MYVAVLVAGGEFVEGCFLEVLDVELGFFEPDFLEFRGDKVGRFRGVDVPDVVLGYVAFEAQLYDAVHPEEGQPG